MKIKMGLIIGSVFFMSLSNAQESCDSTCNTPIILKATGINNKSSINKITHNYNDYKVVYEYKTEACPSGYQGRNGAVGAINERRAVITFATGNTSVGEWIASSDNCEPIPVTPPQPPVQGTTFYFNQICRYMDVHVVGTTQYGCINTNIQVTVNTPNFVNAYGFPTWEGSYFDGTNNNLKGFSLCPQNSPSMNGMFFRTGGFYYSLADYDYNGVLNFAVKYGDYGNQPGMFNGSPYAFQEGRLILASFCL